MQSERDPITGDIYMAGDGAWTHEFREITEHGLQFGDLRYVSSSDGVERMTCPRHWHDWARGAAVIRRGDDE